MSFFTNNLDSISMILASIISILLGYIVGRKHQLFLEKRSRLMERYQKLYTPFEKLYLKNSKGAFYFTDLPPTVQEQFISILYDNYEYTNSKLKNLIYEFKCCYYGDEKDIKTANLKFHEIACEMSDQFNEIGKKLYFDGYNINA